MPEPRRIAWVAFLLLLLSLGTPPSLARADEDLELARQVRQLSGAIMSPFCPGRTLADCPSPNATVQRDRIRTWLESGLTEAEIRARLDRDFGRFMAQNGFEPTLAPVPKGASVWIWPSVLLILGSLVLAFVLARVQRGKAPAVDLSGDRIRALERELDAQLEEKGIGGHTPPRLSDARAVRGSRASSPVAPDASASNESSDHSKSA